MYAVILAGGKGERLRPMTEDRPKPMVEVMGMPVLEYQIRWLKLSGMKGAVISCGYRHEVIEDYFGKGERWGLDISYAVETEPLGRGGGIKQALSKVRLRDESGLVVVTNGDIITRINLRKTIESHSASGAMATIVLVPLISPYGVVDLGENGCIHGFREKPELPYWINGGVYVFSEGIHDLLPDKGDHEDTTFPRLAREGLLNGFVSRDYWRAIDTSKDLSEAKKDLEKQMIRAFLGEEEKT
ncbi:MAG: nucleotidyltransferase family protein [Candidatus Latescibacterota bacterium]